MLYSFVKDTERGEEMKRLAIVALLLCTLTLFGCIVPILTGDPAPEYTAESTPEEVTTPPPTETLPPPEPEFFPNEGDDEQSKRY